MSRRWPVYEKAQAKRAEEQRVRDAELARVLASQAKKLAKQGASTDDDAEVSGERNDAQVAGTGNVQSGQGSAQVKVVSRKRGGSNGQNVERQAQL